MIPLDKDLQTVKKTIDEFGDITLRVLNYLPNVLSRFEEKNEYRIFTSELCGILIKSE